MLTFLKKNFFKIITLIFIFDLKITYMDDSLISLDEKKSWYEWLCSKQDYIIVPLIIIVSGTILYYFKIYVPILPPIPEIDREACYNVFYSLSEIISHKSFCGISEILEKRFNNEINSEITINY
jgi:hypothetical protein